MDHLALAVSDQDRVRRFYEPYLGFVAKPAPRADGVLMLHDAAGFSLALGETREPIRVPGFSTSARVSPQPTRFGPSAN